MAAPCNEQQGGICLIVDVLVDVVMLLLVVVMMMMMASTIVRHYVRNYDDGLQICVQEVQLLQRNRATLYTM